ncbi:MAG: hypothetical protein Ta2D_13280 [Rickettsiales bacterium]|nr:MAG: hypothetical protein Ta2D_13280 [Rickettsiales bacterium]
MAKNLRLGLFVEGKTEKTYIEKLKSFLIRKYGEGKILNIDVKLAGGIIDITLCNKIIKRGELDNYDYIYFVVDREEDKARQQIITELEYLLNNHKYKKYIKLIVSNPSFEIWLLFHFLDTKKKNYKIKEIISELNKFGNYDKEQKILEQFCDENIFNNKNLEKFENAITNAIKNKNNDYQYSCSNFYEFIDILNKN